jgi:hypothetical protein
MHNDTSLDYVNPRSLTALRPELVGLQQLRLSGLPQFKSQSAPIPGHGV